MVSNMSPNFGLNINNARQLSFTPYSKTLRNWGVNSDVFQKTTGSKTIENKEIERLFPNGELNKIYNNIANHYGLEVPPTLELINDFDKGDRGYYSAHNNSVKIVLDFLKPEARKFLIEKDGQKFYTVGDSRGLLFRTKEEDIKKEQKYIESLGLKAAPEPLTDDDKKKLMVFLLAHELSHAYQNQIIRHTEGLNEWDMIKSRFNNKKPQGMNLIELQLFLLDRKKEYNISHNNMNFEKIYSQNSEEGKQAKIWYDSSVGYQKPEDNYQENINNPLEIYANEKAYKYLKENFGYFEGAIDF